MIQGNYTIVDNLLKAREFFKEKGANDATFSALKFNEEVNTRAGILVNTRGGGDGDT